MSMLIPHLSSTREWQVCAGLLCVASIVLACIKMAVLDLDASQLSKGVLISSLFFALLLPLVELGLVASLARNTYYSKFRHVRCVPSANSS